MATSAILESYLKIIDALESIADDLSQKGETRQEAENIARVCVYVGHVESNFTTLSPPRKRIEFENMCKPLSIISRPLTWFEE